MINWGRRVVRKFLSDETELKQFLKSIFVFNFSAASFDLGGFNVELINKLCKEVKVSSHFHD